MAEIKNIGSINYLINNSRVFLPSGNINIFPCSRRGQSTTGGFAYDPEARLNTERTNRLHTALNGFTDKFIINKEFSDGDTLEFVLAGYYIKAKNFRPAGIAEALGLSITDNIIYAHLSLHNDISLRDISLNAEGYATEILYRQNSDIPANKNYLDVHFSGDDFFFGVSFTSNKDASDTNVVPYVLPIFKKSAGGWELVQTSLLPKIEHDTELDSIKISGDFTVEHTKEDGTKQTSFKITKEVTALGPTQISELDTDEATLGSLIVNNAADLKDALTVAGKTTINNDLEVADTTSTPTLKVDTITSKSDSDDAIITVQKPLKVEDNINVGTPTTPATANNGGCIVAQYDITAEEDLIAKRDIEAAGKATVKSLVVGERADADSTDAGVITVKKLVKTPILEATTEVKTPQLRVNRITSDEGEITVDNKKLIVNKSLEMLAKEGATTPAKATLEQAVIGDLTVKKDTKLKDSTGKITASIVDSDDLNQKIDNAYYDVPVIFVKQLNSASSNEYQLQISRANVVPYKNN